MIWGDMLWYSILSLLSCYELNNLSIYHRAAQFEHTILITDDGAEVLTEERVSHCYYLFNFHKFVSATATPMWPSKKNVSMLLLGQPYRRFYLLQEYVWSCYFPFFSICLAVLFFRLVFFCFCSLNE